MFFNKNLETYDISNINLNLRSRAIDWLIEVVFYYNETNFLTYFKTIKIIDNYLFKNPSEKNIHILIIVCFFLANKLVNQKKLKIDQLVVLGKNNFTKNDLLNKESEILNILNYDLSSSDLLEIFDTVFYNNFLDFRDSIELKSIRGYCIFILLILVYDFNFITIDPFYLSYAVIIFIIQTHYNKLFQLHGFQDINDLKKQQDIIIQDLIQYSCLDTNILNHLILKIYNYLKICGNSDYLQNNRPLFFNLIKKFSLDYT